MWNQIYLAINTNQIEHAIICIIMLFFNRNGEDVGKWEVGVQKRRGLLLVKI